MPVHVTCADKGPLLCPLCDTLVLNEAGEQLVTDVSQARGGCPHLWCTACLSQCIINSLRTARGTFCCPRASCQRQILEFDTRRCLVAAPDPSAPAAPKASRGAGGAASARAEPDITFSSTHLGDPDRVLPRRGGQLRVGRGRRLAASGLPSPRGARPQRPESPRCLHAVTLLRGRHPARRRACRRPRCGRAVRYRRVQEECHGVVRGVAGPAVRLYPVDLHLEGSCSAGAPALLPPPLRHRRQLPAPVREHPHLIVCRLRRLHAADRDLRFLANFEPRWGPTRSLRRPTDVDPVGRSGGASGSCGA
ncbi:hypothetical protein T484DRAFT_2451688 [Baffinella frigidus]|nr:hypothetical protein T484DRAFT_2451688 [Cryptophyta sp. CCMP2293]